MKSEPLQKSHGGLHRLKRPGPRCPRTVAIASLTMLRCGCFPSYPPCCNLEPVQSCGFMAIYWWLHGFMVCVSASEVATNKERLHTCLLAQLIDSAAVATQRKEGAELSGSCCV